MKVKLTQKQADALENAQKKLTIEQIIRIKLFSNFDIYTSLNTLTLKDLCNALFNGYEVELPPTPKFDNDKINVCFNNNIDALLEERAIFLGLKKENMGWKGVTSFSIKEAEEIGTTLLNLVEYYKKYSQND
jgi:hypothetical protein